MDKVSLVVYKSEFFIYGRFNFIFLFFILFYPIFLFLIPFLMASLGFVPFGFVSGSGSVIRGFAGRIEIWLCPLVWLHDVRSVWMFWVNMILKCMYMLVSLWKWKIFVQLKRNWSGDISPGRSEGSAIHLCR